MRCLRKDRLNSQRRCWERVRASVAPARTCLPALETPPPACPAARRATHLECGGVLAAPNARPTGTPGYAQQARNANQNAQPLAPAPAPSRRIADDPSLAGQPGENSDLRPAKCSANAPAPNPLCQEESAPARLAHCLCLPHYQALTKATRSKSLPFSNKVCSFKVCGWSSAVSIGKISMVLPG